MYDNAHKHSNTENWSFFLRESQHMDKIKFKQTLKSHKERSRQTNKQNNRKTASTQQDQLGQQNTKSG